MKEHPYWCSEVGHPQLCVHVWYCQKEQSFHLSWESGTCDAPSMSTFVDFGPFDEISDVIDYLNQLTDRRWFEAWQRGKTGPHLPID